MQHFRFNSKVRKEGESVADYVADLRKLAEFCNYGDTLNKMLRDRLIWGVKDTSIQKKLLGEPDLTLDIKAFSDIHQTSIWYLCCTWNFSEGNGDPTSGYSQGIPRVFPVW